MSRIPRRDVLKMSGTAVLGGLAGCVSGSSSPDTESGDDEPIVLGALEPLTGAFSPWGGPHLQGAEFAVDEINSDGGVLGRPLELATADSESSPSTADTEFRRMVEQEDAVAVFGPASSDVGVRTATTAEDLSVPQFLNQSGTEQVIDEDTRHTFRVSLLPAAKSMEAQAGLAAEAGYSSISAITADYAWGESARAAIEDEFDVSVDIQVAPLGTSDFKPYIRQIPEDVEMVVASGHPPGALSIAKQLYQLGYEPALITGSAPPPNIILDTLGEDVGRGYADYHMTDFNSQAFQDVATRFAETTGSQMGPFISYGYVAVQLIAAAIENAGEARPSAIAEATRGISFDTLYAAPIEYTDYGELKNQVQLYSEVARGAPEYLDEGEYHYEEVYRTDPLPPLAP